MKSIIQQLVKIKKINKEIVSQVKRQMAGADHLPPPSTAELLKEYRHLLKLKKIKPNKILEKLLLKRPTRTLSGVAIVAVLTKPWPCPGRCVYCPDQKGMPKSYLKNEPAAQRAYLTKFAPYQQVQIRLQMLYNNGHPTDKIELIIKGGSWSAYPWKYQVWFIKECFRAANDFKIKNQKSKIKITDQNLKISLIKTQKKNETAANRIVGLTLETRPDLITPEEIKRLRLLGGTRLELGVQQTDNKILKLIRRGHNLEQVKNATRLLKQAGFKVDYHLMPQLPGSTPTKDYEMFKKVFADADLRPDMLKIYPCTVVANSLLYQWYKKVKPRTVPDLLGTGARGKFCPYSTKKLIELLIKVKSQLIPCYCRISRLIRDIPSTEIIAGNRITNLREVIQAEMKKRGLKCRCLRCREVGHAGIANDSSRQNQRRLSSATPKLFIEKYSASDGMEYFLSFEDPKRRIVFAFCRLRINSGNPTPTLLPQQVRDRHLVKGGGNSSPLARGRDKGGWEYPAFIRELHTYGQLVPLKHLNIQTFKQGGLIQHRGLGKKLIAEAEKICRTQGVTKLAVIAGVGVRNYYRQLGYHLENTYLVKRSRNGILQE